MGSRPKVLYVESDVKRAREMAKLLTSAGFVVWTCPESCTPRRGFERPDFVLISDDLPTRVGAASAELWPDAPVLRVAPSEGEDSILLRLATYQK